MPSPAHTRPTSTAIAVLAGALLFFGVCPFRGQARGASNLAVKASSNASDSSVGAVVEVLAEPRSACTARIYKAHVVRALPPIRVGAAGAVRWQWQINHGVPAGEWAVRVSCRGWQHWQASRVARFPSVAGRGPGRARELFVPHTLTITPGTGSHSGSGGGGTSLYPVGQCTWWVSLLRPDLPWFPGEEGNALNWATAARHRQLPVGTVPTVGAVAVFAPGQDGAGEYGHVAYVTATDETHQTITISEYNYAGRPGKNVRTVSALGLSYIYKPGEPSQQRPGESKPPLTPVHKTEGAPTYPETAGGAAQTWTNYTNAGGHEGATIAKEQTIQVYCRLEGFKVEDGDTWWYQIASSPWNGEYYVSADPFYNDGATSGTLTNTPLVDPAVPECPHV